MDTDSLTWVIIVAVVGCLVGAMIGYYKGRTLAGFLWGLFVGPIGWGLILFGPDLRDEVRFQKPNGVSSSDPDIQAYLEEKKSREGTQD